MRIYFADGRLEKRHPFCYAIDAADGIGKCKNDLEFIRKTDPESSVYTNLVEAIDEAYYSCGKDGLCSLYVMDRFGMWRNISEYTNVRHLSSSGIRRLYVSGKFKKLL